MVRTPCFHCQGHRPYGVAKISFLIKKTTYADKEPININHPLEGQKTAMAQRKARSQKRKKDVSGKPG